MSRPEQLDSPSFEGLKRVCNDFVEFVESGDFHEDHDFFDYISEQAISDLYGPGFWAWYDNAVDEDGS